MAKRRLEEIMQAECSQWFWNNFHSERRMLHCNMNNQYNEILGSQAKALGVVSGVSDMELILWGGVTMYIELKTPTGTQFEEQIDFMNKIRERGHQYVIIRSVQAFKDLVNGIYGTSK